MSPTHKPVSLLLKELSRCDITVCTLQHKEQAFCYLHRQCRAPRCKCSNQKAVPKCLGQPMTYPKYKPELINIGSWSWRVQKSKLLVSSPQVVDNLIEC